MSNALRGKYAEGWVKKILDLHTQLTVFDYERIPDAFSSRGGYAKAQCGDFQAWHAGKPFLFEVKEVNHAFRLPAGNFGRDQRARIMKRQYAGVVCYVLIYFKPIDAWRAVPIGWFENIDSGSWDFREVPTHTLGFIMNQLFGSMAIVAPKYVLE